VASIGGASVTLGSGTTMAVESVLGTQTHELISLLNK
jgi:hypothetical protein